MNDAAKETSNSDRPPEHPRTRYEEKDVRFGCILALLVSAAGILVVQFSVVWFLFRHETGSQADAKRSAYPLAPSPFAQLPPEPRLEQIDRMESKGPTPAEDRLAAMVAALHTSGPVAEKGFVHIPIEEAIRKVVAQLPIRKQPPAEVSRSSPGDETSNPGPTSQGASP